jgi:hypothetical protein
VRLHPDRQRPPHCRPPVPASPATHSHGEIHPRGRPTPRRGVVTPAPPLLFQATPQQLSPAALSGQPSSKLPAPLHTTRLSHPRAHLRMHESLAAKGERALPGPASPPVNERSRRPLYLPHPAASARGLCSWPGSDALPTPTLGKQEAWANQSPRVIVRRPGRPVRSSHRAAAPSATVPSSPTSSARPDLGEQGAGRQAAAAADGGALHRLRFRLSICMRPPKGQGMAQPPRPAVTITLGLQKRAKPRKPVAKGGEGPGARASATITPGQPRAACLQRSTSRRRPTTGRGAAARAAERITLGAASGRHGWRTASRREGACTGTAIAQHHAGTGGRAG